MPLSPILRCRRQTRWLTALSLAWSVPAILPASAETTWYEYYQLFSRNDTVLDDAIADSELFAAQIGNRWGLIDQRGVLTAEPQFQWTDDGIDGRARAIQDRKTGYIDGRGKWLIDPTFDWLDRFSQGYAVFRERGRYGFIDRRGDVKLEPRLEGALRFKENYAAVQLDGKIGFLDRRLRWQIEPTYDVARSFHQGLAAVRFPDDSPQAGRWGYVDLRGQVQWLDPTGRVAELRDFNDNLAAFAQTQDDGSTRWGYLDQGFRVAIPARYDAARDFTDRLAAVRQSQGAGLWGFIDRSGDWALTPQFDDADDFDDRLAMIRHEGKFGFIDREGSTGLYPTFAYAEPFENGYATVSNGDQFAYVGPTGGVLWDPADFLRAEQRNAAGTLGRKGPVLLPEGAVILDRRVGTQARSRRYGYGSAVPHTYLRVVDDAGSIPVPYVPEFRYEERLPAPPVGGLTEPVPNVGDQSNPDPTESDVTENQDGKPTQTVVPDLPGVVPQADETLDRPEP